MYDVPSVPTDLPVARVQFSHLVQGDDKEGNPTSVLSHGCNKVRVHSAKLIVVDAIGNVPVLLACWFSKNLENSELQY